MARLPDTEAWAVFAKLAEIGTFAGAARDLGVSKATISKAISRLEERIGASLLNRTSRQLSLTTIGRNALAGASRLLDAAIAIETEARAGSAEPRGRIHIAAPMSFGVKHVAPLLPLLVVAYPQLVFDLHFDDSAVDVVGEGFDIVLRIAALVDSSLRARRVCDIRRLLVGSPAYFDRVGRPTEPHHLEQHACFSYSNLASPGRWRLRHTSGAEATVVTAGPLTVNNATAMMPALAAGIGIAMQPTFMIHEELARHVLEAVMTDWSLPPIALHIVTPPGSHRPACIAAVVEFLAMHLAERLEPRQG